MQIRIVDAVTLTQLTFYFLAENGRVATTKFNVLVLAAHCVLPAFVQPFR